MLPEQASRSCSSRSARLSSIRSASACRSSASGFWPLARLPAWPPPGAPTSRRFAVEYDDTVEPMPQKPSINEATEVARLEVAGDAGRTVAVEEHPLAGQRRERHEDVGLVLGPPPGELVLRRDRRDHAEVVAALLDRREVDLEVPAGPVRDDRVARLVHRDRVPLPLDVLDVLGRARDP